MTKKRMSGRTNKPGIDWAADDVSKKDAAKLKRLEKAKTAEDVAAIVERKPVAMKVVETRRLSAEKVEQYLTSILPEGVPPIHRSIDRARPAKRGRDVVIVADVTMFDGLPATVEVFRHRLGLGHRWTRIEGGAAFYEDGRWQRESDSESTS